MVLNDTAVKSMAQEEANRSGKPQSIYQRPNGEYIFCASGMLPLIKQYLPANEQVRYIETREPKSNTE